MMTKECREMLNVMLGELITCWQRPQPEKLLVEAAFRIAQKHCTGLQEYCWRHGFAGEEEEIHFFKHIHPQFAGRMMYYSIIYESLLSCPATVGDAVNFWKKEMERYDRFSRKYEGCVNYLAEGRTDEDGYYFLRKSRGNVVTLPGTTFFACCEDYTIWSTTSAAYLAEKSYRQFVECRLAKIEQDVMM